MATTDDNDSETSESTLSTFDKVGFAFGHILNDFTAGVWFSYTLLYFKTIIELPGHWAGTMIMLGQLFDAASTSIVGILTDKFFSKRKWHAFGTFLIVFSFPFIFIKLPFLDDSTNILWKISYYTIWIFIFQFGWPIVQITHLAMIPELSLTERDRIELTSCKYLFSIISNMLVFVVTWINLHISERKMNIIGPEDYENFKEIILFLICIGIAMTVLFQYSLTLSNYSERCAYNLKNHEITQKNDELNTTVIAGNNEHIFKDLRLYENTLLYMFSRVFVVISLCYIPLWLNEQFTMTIADNVDQVAYIPFVVYSGSLTAVLLLKYLSKFLHQKVIYLIGSILIIIACLGIFLSTYALYEIVAVAILVGLGSTTTQISSLCIIANMVGDKTKSGGAIYSVVTFCDKLLTGLVIILIEINDHNHKGYYGDILAFSGIAAVFSMIIMLIFECLKEKDKMNVTND